jgi:hypothetical protein
MQPGKNTVFIFTHCFTPSIRGVADWLLHYKAPIAINNVYETMAVGNQALGQGPATVCKAVWFNGYKPPAEGSDIPALNQNLQADYWAVCHFFSFLQLQGGCRLLGYPFYGQYASKLRVLYQAQQTGFAIPATQLVHSKVALQQFKQQHRAIITKALADATEIAHAGMVSTGYRCQLVTQDMIDAMAEHFAPSLVQAHIEKQFEIRVFYLAGDCYAMAIFSQSNPLTQLDFRHYDRQRPNRYVPYLLPPPVAQKITALMHRLELNTGSIDLIYSTAGEYVFLEVNETGQWGFLSNCCNYYIDKKIATYLYNGKTIGI